MQEEREASEEPKSRDLDEREEKEPEKEQQNLPAIIEQLKDTNIHAINVLYNLYGFIEDFREVLDLPDISFAVCVCRSLLKRAIL